MKEMDSSTFTPKDTDTAKGNSRSPAQKKHQLSRRAKSFSFSSSPSSHTSSNSSSSSSSSSNYSSPFTPNSINSAVPFSWEQQPGIPKNPRTAHQPNNPIKHPDPTLPLPPPLRSNSDTFVSVTRKKRPELGFVRDPFAVALMECSKEHRTGEEDELWKRPINAGPRRRTVIDRFGLNDLYKYSSCKTTCSVADSAVYVPRSVRPMAAHGILNRRH